MASTRLPPRVGSCGRGRASGSARPVVAAWAPPGDPAQRPRPGKAAAASSAAAPSRNAPDARVPDSSDRQKCPHRAFGDARNLAASRISRPTCCTAPAAASQPFGDRGPRLLDIAGADIAGGSRSTSTRSSASADRPDRLRRGRALYRRAARRRQAAVAAVDQHDDYAASRAAQLAHELAQGTPTRLRRTWKCRRRTARSVPFAAPIGARPAGFEPATSRSGDGFAEA